jgi:hypothetical protein
MQQTHIPLRKWFLAVFMETHDERGVSALQLRCGLVVNYKTLLPARTHQRRHGRVGVSQARSLPPTIGLADVDDTGSLVSLSHLQHMRPFVVSYIIMPDTNPWGNLGFGLSANDNRTSLRFD